MSPSVLGINCSFRCAFGAASFAQDVRAWFTQLLAAPSLIAEAHLSIVK